MNSLLSIAKKELRAIHKESSTSGSLNNFSVIYEDKSNKRFLDRDCFADIYLRFGIRLREGCQYIVSASKHFDKLPYEECKNYLKWLLCHSGAASMFVTKDPEYAWRVGVVVDCDAPNQAVGWGLTMHRSIWEHQAHVRTFEKLYKEGIPAHICAMTMAYVRTGVGGEIVRCSGIAHGPFSSVYHGKLYRLSRRYRKRNCLGLRGEPSFKKAKGYDAYFGLFSKEERPYDYPFSNHLNEVLEFKYAKGLFGEYRMIYFDDLVKAVKDFKEVL